jgi:hypothetical protein
MAEEQGSLKYLSKGTYFLQWATDNQDQAGISK